MTPQAKILLVEDEAITVMALKMELTQAGFHVLDSVATGEEALASIAHERPDVIVMDMRLAGEWDGFETAQRIRQSHPIPIIFMTGYPDKALIERMTRMESAGHVVKPVSMVSLMAAIHSVLDKKE